AQERAGGGRCDAVLAGARLGYDAALAHAPGQQRLAERVVDLVRAGMREIFAFQEQPGPRRFRGAARLGKRRRATHIRRKQVPNRFKKRRILTGLEVGLRQRLHRRDERLGHEAPPELAKVTARVWIAPPEHRTWSLRHHDRTSPKRSPLARPTAAKNAFI